MNSIQTPLMKPLALMAGIALVLCAFFFPPKAPVPQAVCCDSPFSVIGLWGDREPPGATDIAGKEGDLSKASDGLIAGRPIVKLGNVSSPELHIYRPDAGTVGDAAVVVCPGGGFSILAWDLEGVEVAKWLNSIGITAGVLKYRVPTNDLENVWQAPVQDTQRAISIMRGLSDELGVSDQKIGVMGFSSGAIAAARAGLMEERQYAIVDQVDRNGCVPDFMALVYAGGLIDTSVSQLKSDLVVDRNTPPVFMVHALDDHVSIDTPMTLLKAMKAAGASAELHVYDAGGHGYGVRPVKNLPVTMWPKRCQEWLKRHELSTDQPIVLAEPEAESQADPEPAKVAGEVEAEAFRVVEGG